LKALAACLLIGGAAIAYVRQQHELVRLAERRKNLEQQWQQLQEQNLAMQAQLNRMLASGYLEREVRRQLPDLVPTRPGQVVTVPMAADRPGWWRGQSARSGLATGRRPR
jgi:hypothetical protein